MARFLIPEQKGSFSLGFDALDGDMMKLAFADPIPLPFQNRLSGNLGPRSGFGGGAPLSSLHFPTKMRLSGRKRQLVDFNNAYHIYLVNRRFIEVVERFQTDIQCLPVECVWRDKTSAGEHYFFFTTVLVDAVVRERTTSTWSPTGPGEGLWQPEIYLGETFTFDMARLGGAHMWVDPNMPTEGALVSEALYAALDEAKIESFYHGAHFAEI